MFAITKTISLLPDSLDLGVNAFADCIGDAMPQVRQNLCQILAEHTCFLDHRLEPRVGGPEIPPFKMADRPANSFVPPKVTKALLDRPSPRCFKVHPFQILESFFMYVRKVFLRVKPDVFRSCQCLISRLLQCSMLFFSHFVDRLDHVHHQMIAVKDNLLIGVWHMLPNRSQIRIPDVYSNSLNFLTGIPYVFHRRPLQIVDYSDVIVPSTSRLLVHSNLPRLLSLFLQSPSDRPVHDMPGLIPTDPQYLGRTQNVARPQHINRQPLKKRCKSSFFLCPRQTHLPHSVLLAVNPRWPCMKKRHELTTIQMTPGPLRRMIVNWHHLSTLWTRPAQNFSMSSPNIYSLAVHVQFYTFYLPGQFKAQKIAIKLCILHDSSPPGAILSYLLPTRKSDEPYNFISGLL